MPRQEHKSVVEFLKARVPFLLSSSRKHLEALEAEHDRKVSELESARGMAETDRDAARARIAELEAETATTRAELEAYRNKPTTPPPKQPDPPKQEPPPEPPKPEGT